MPFSNITSDVLALSFDSASSPSIKLKLPGQVYGTHPLGWGFAWYPNDNHAAIVAKDSSANNTDILMNALKEGTNFRSTVFLAKVKGSASGYTHHETQPFSRSYGGRDWTFWHNGDLDKAGLREKIAGQSGFLEPLGKTDSEMAFVFLLEKIQQSGERRLAEIAPETIHSWMRELDALGSADICLSDGTSIACHYGTRSERALYYTRLTPPLGTSHFRSDSASIFLDDPRDAFSTAFVISSTRFDAGEWRLMQPGQMMLLRKGALVWTSGAESEALITNTPYDAPPVASFTQAQNQPQLFQSTLNLRAMTRTPDGQPLTFRAYDILHTTEYTYSLPIEHSTHTFRLQPVEDALQEVVFSELTLSAEGEEIRYDDVFGNHSFHFTIHRPYQRLFIESRSRVKVFASPPDDYSLSQRRSTIPLIWMPWQRQMMMPYLLPAELPETELRELTRYAMSFVERNDYHLMDTLKDINQSIYRDYHYMPGTTSMNTTPFEVFASRRGVCQDFANLFICLAQLLSVPARYRMGYIYTGASYSNKIQSDASHAWVEIYLPYLGWRGFDPTNGVMVAQDHVRVACGRNYRDATPTSGTIFKGGGIEALNVHVKMDEVVL